MEEWCEVLCRVAAGGDDGGKGECKCSVFGQALEEVLEKLPGVTDRGVLAKVFTLAVGHDGQHYWTNSVNRQLAKKVLSVICTKWGHLNCEGLLAGEQVFVSAMFSYLKTVLTKESWKEHPVHKQALVGVLKCLKHPNLASHLPVVLPPILWMLEDYSDYHRVLALSSITHVVQQMDHTELRWHGRAELLYQAVKPLLYVSSAQVVCSVHACLLELLPVIDHWPGPAVVPAKHTNMDTVFAILLDALAKESKVSLQKAYASQLSSYIQQLGIFNARHMKQCLALVLAGLDGLDLDLKNHYLHALASLMAAAWPRMPPHKLSILKALCRVVKEVDTLTEGQSGTLDLIVKCFQFLMAACPELQVEYQWLEKSCNHHVLEFCLHKTLAGSLKHNQTVITETD